MWLTDFAPNVVLRWNDGTAPAQFAGTKSLGDSAYLEAYLTECLENAIDAVSGLPPVTFTVPIAGKSKNSSPRYVFVRAPLDPHRKTLDMQLVLRGSESKPRTICS